MTIAHSYYANAGVKGKLFIYMTILLTIANT